MAEMNTRTPLQGSPLSIRQLRAGIGTKGPLFDYLKHFARRDVVNHFDDFLVDTLNTFWTAVANGGGASAASFTVNVQENGVIRATTGTANDDTASASLIGAANWYGDRNCGIEIRWKPITAVTDVRIEMGFVDVVPSSNKPIGNNISTPTVNASVVDAAVYLYNESSSTATSELLTIGTTISAAKSTFTPPTTIAAGTYNVVRLQLIGNQVFLWMDGQLMASHAAAATDYVEGGSALAPFVYIKALSATSKSIDLDYVHVWADRN